MTGRRALHPLPISFEPPAGRAAMRATVFRPSSRGRLVFACAVAMALCAVQASAQAGGPAGHVAGESPPAGPAALRVETNLPATGAVARDVAIRLTLSRPLLRPAERVAVFIDRTDVTALFRADAQALAYERGVILLPRGRHELVVYLVEVASGEWTEVARQPFQTLGPLGFQPGKTDPSLTAGYARRVADGYEPASNAPAQLVENVDLQFRLTTEHVRRNLKVSSQTSLVGASKQEKALRYRDLQEDAPRLDLSSYLLQAAEGPVGLSVGHVSAGNQRHLVNRFASRGASLTLRPSGRTDVSISALNGSNDVGWDNLLGMDDGDHRIITGSLGLEALPTPGALRLELSGLQGSIRPGTGLNRAAVSDAEHSQGLAFRVVASGLDRRLRIDGGLAYSTFDNPDDPALTQGLAVVAVDEETSGARYLEASFDALRDLGLGHSRTARLALGYRHERVDPMFRSVGAHTQADRLQDQLEARADVAGVSLQGSFSGARTNLDDVASILTTRTERSQLSIGVPVARVTGSGSLWLPALQYRTDRTHQYGDGIPVNSGFSATHVPDQVSLNQAVQADWQIRKLTVSYGWNRSYQDNRQVGRETADLTVVRHGLTTRLAATRRLSVTLEGGFESSRNHERDETDVTTRWDAQLQWQPLDRSSLSLRLSDTSTEDLAATRRRRQSQLNAQWSSALPLLSRVQGQYFVRFTRSRASSFTAAVDQDDRRRAWWLDTGLNVTPF
jgi:hypothetical protein